MGHSGTDALALAGTDAARLIPDTPAFEMSSAYWKSVRPRIGRLISCHYSEKKKRTQPPPKENLLENFSDLKEKLSRLQKPYKNQENHIHHRNISSVDPIFSAKKSSALEQGGIWVFFPATGAAASGCGTGKKPVRVIIF